MPFPSYRRRYPTFLNLAPKCNVLMSHRSDVGMLAILHYNVLILGKTLWFEDDFPIEFCPQTIPSPCDIPDILISFLCDVSMLWHSATFLETLPALLAQGLDLVTLLHPPLLNPLVSVDNACWARLIGY